MMFSKPPEANTQSPWRPIETAPKDGAYILVYSQWKWSYQEPTKQRMTMIASYCKSYDTFTSRTNNPYEDEAVSPTHWMPLPEPPKGGES